MEIDEKALEAADEAFKLWMNSGSTKQITRRILEAYESSRPQSSRDAVIEECREALFVQIVLAQRAASYDDISEILDALKRPANRTPEPGFEPPLAM